MRPPTIVQQLVQASTSIHTLFLHFLACPSPHLGSLANLTNIEGQRSTLNFWQFHLIVVWVKFYSSHLSLKFKPNWPSSLVVASPLTPGTERGQLHCWSNSLLLPVGDLGHLSSIQKIKKTDSLFLQHELIIQFVLLPLQ